MDQGVQTQGLGALRNLAFGPAETEQVVEADGISLAVIALKVGAPFRA